MTGVPAGWQSAALGDVCRITSGATPKTGVPEYWGGNIPWITPLDMSRNEGQYMSQGERSITEAGLDSCSAKVIPKGSVIYSSRAPIGYAAISLQDVTTNQGCKSATPPDFIDAKYLYYYLIWRTPEIKSRASGTTFLEISGKKFAETTLAWPPLDEQRRIVAILEEHLSRLDAAVAGIAHARIQSEWAWVSFLSAVLTRVRMVGESRPLGEVSTTRLGKMLDSKRNAGTATPYLRNQNVQWRHIDHRDVLEVPLSADEISEFAVVEGDLLVCEGGEPGRCAVVTTTPDHPLAFQKALHRVRVHDGLDPNFLQLTLEALAACGDLEQQFTGTTIKHLPQERLRALTVWVPDEGTQLSVVKEAATLRTTLDRLLDAIWRVDRRSLFLRRSVLKSAFSGHLTKEFTSV